MNKNYHFNFLKLKGVWEYRSVDITPASDRLC